MKRFLWIAAILLVALAQCAHADGISYFNITQVTADIGPYGDDNVFFFSLTGPGTYITGVGGIPCDPNHWCFGGVFPPGSSVYPQIGQIFLSNFNDATVGGKNYGREGLGFTSPFSIDVLGNLTFPVNPHSSTFSACVPATVSGPIDGFVSGPESFEQIVLNTPTGGTFCTTWDTYAFANGEFTFRMGNFSVQQPVPEPGTLIMLGSGLLAVAGGLRRKLMR